MQTKILPSSRDVAVAVSLAAALLLTAALGSRALSLQAPLAPVFDTPAQTSRPAPNVFPAAPVPSTLPDAPAAPPAGSPAGPGQLGSGAADQTTPADPGTQPPGRSGEVERPGRMFDDMPVDPPSYVPGRTAPRIAPGE